MIVKCEGEDEDEDPEVEDQLSYAAADNCLSLSLCEMGMNNPTVLKLGLAVVGLCIAGYILGPPLYWHFMEGLAAVSHSSSSCPPCQCDCSSQPLLSIPEGTLLFYFNLYLPKCLFPSLDLFAFLVRST